MNFYNTIPWDIIDAPIPDGFFGEDATRVNLIRHGIKNGIITQSRVLGQLKELDPDSDLTPRSKYKGNVAKKIKWIEEYYFPKCLKEIQWFEAKWGGDVRLTLEKAREMIKNNVMADDKASKVKDKLGTYQDGIAEF